MIATAPQPSTPGSDAINQAITAIDTPSDSIDSHNGGSLNQRRTMPIRYPKLDPLTEPPKKRDRQRAYNAVGVDR